MPRGKKADTTAKANGSAEHLPETPPPLKAHNGVTPTEMKAFLVRATNLETEEVAIRETLASIRSRQRILKKSIKDAGGNYDTFKILFASSKMREEEAQAWLEQVVDYHGMINVRVSFDAEGQGSLDEITDPSPKTDGDRDLDAAQSYQEGYKAALADYSPDDCMYQAGTINYVQWRKGFSDGASAKGVADRMSAA